MRAWTSDELSKVEAAEELDLALVKRDGTLRNPVTMWVVRHGDDLYVRSVNGRRSSWFRSARHDTKPISKQAASTRTSSSSRRTTSTTN
jgi:hypothetical protein